MRQSPPAKLKRQPYAASDSQLLADSIPYAVVILDLNGRVVFANKAAFSILAPRSSTRDEALPNTIESIIATEPQLFETANATLGHQKPVRRQFLWRNKIYLLDTRPLISNGVMDGCVLSFNDITETITKARQQEFLYQISSALADSSISRSLNQVLHVAVRQILKSMRIDAAKIMLYDPETRTLRVAIGSTRSDSSNHERQPRIFRLNEGLAGKCAAKQRTYTAYDVTSCRTYAQRQTDDHGALLTVPIVSQGATLGVLNISDDAPRYFTESEVQFATIVANELAAAIDRSRLYIKLDRRVQLLSKLSLVSSTFTGGPDGAWSERTLAVTCELLEAKSGAFYLRQANNDNRLVLVGHHNADRLPKTFTLGRSATAREVIEKGGSSVINEAEAKSGGPVGLRKYGVKSCIAVPVFHRSRICGILFVYNKRYGAFDNEDTNLLTIISHRIGTRFENQQLIKTVESEKDLLDQIIENTSDGVAVIDRDHKIQIWNQYLEHLTGLNSSDVVGLSAHTILFHRLGMSRLSRAIYASERRSRGPVTPIEECLRDSRGSIVWVNASLSYICNTRDNVENTIVVMRDVSRERDLINAKNEFVSLATHELRTPLTAIKGYLSMILVNQTANMTTKQQEYFAKAYASTERLVYLVEDLLDTVRIEEHRLVIEPTEFNIGEVVHEVVEEFGARASSKRLTLHHLPATSIVRADMTKTKQVIENLVDNAIKYTPAGGTITVMAQEEGDQLVVSVADTGVGIASKHYTSVFERFSRVANPLSIRAGGTGLGLYIVKNLVELQGGRIWVESELKRGSTFRFTIPLATAHKKLTQETPS